MGVRLPTPAAANGLPEVQRLRLFDADALAEAVRGARIEHIQLDRGRFQGELKRIDFGAIALDSGCYTRRLLARGAFPPGKIMIGCVLDSCEAGWINGYRFDRNNVVIFPTGAELDYVLPAGTRWCGIPLSDALLEQAGCQEIRIDRIKVMLGNWPLTRLMSGLLHNHPGATGRVACAAPLPPPNKAILLNQIRHVLEHYQGDRSVRQPTLQRRMAMLRQFEGHVRERIAEPLRLTELCSEIGVSLRVLEYVFKEELDMTPKQYLDLLRLSAFRRELLRNSSVNKTVTEIAGCYGISHLGRLAAAYQQQFGELPSETLRR